MPLSMQHPVLYIKYLIFKLRWLMLEDGDQHMIYHQVHMNINMTDLWDNPEQFQAAQNRGDDYVPDWQDLDAWLNVLGGKA